DVAMSNKTCGIEISPVFHSNQVRHLGGIQRARSMSSDNTRWYCLVQQCDVVDGILGESWICFGLNPRCAVEHGLECTNCVQLPGSVSVLQCHSAMDRKIALCSFDDRTVSHHAGVAHAAR